MKRNVLLRVICCAAVVLFLVLSPRPIAYALAREERLSLFQIRDRVVLETITLYHIASARTYQGSVTAFLEDCAESFEKRHRGVVIDVVGLTPAALAERIENGRVPDAYSFFCGDIYPEQLQPMEQEPCALLSGLTDGLLAVPYLISGYALCIFDGSTDTVELLSRQGVLAADALQAARMKLDAPLSVDDGLFSDGCSGAIVDMRKAGDLMRGEKYPNLITVPFDSFTDQVCYLGISASANAEKATWLAAFFAFLRTSEVQQQLSILGAFPVILDVEMTYANLVIAALFAQYQSGLLTPDPFLWYTHKSKLLEDAALYAAGDTFASERFDKRWKVVFSAGE